MTYVQLYYSLLSPEAFKRNPDYTLLYFSLLYNKQLWSVINQTNYRVFDRFDVCILNKNNGGMWLKLYERTISTAQT